MIALVVALVCLAALAGLLIDRHYRLISLRASNEAEAKREHEGVRSLREEMQAGLRAHAEAAAALSKQIDEHDRKISKINRTAFGS